MKKHFVTLKEAKKALTKERKRVGHEIFHRKDTKRKIRYFVGTHFEWLNL